MTAMNSSASYLVVVFFGAALSNIFALFEDPYLLAASYLLAVSIGISACAKFVVAGRVVAWFCLSYIALFFISPIYVLLSGQQYEDGFGYISYSTVVLFSIFSINCFFLFLLTYFVFSPKLGRLDRFSKLETIVVGVSPGKVIVSFLFLAFIIVALVFLDYGTASFTGLAKETMRNSKGLATLLSLYLIYATIPFYFILAVVARKNKSIIIYAVLLIFALYVFFIFKIRTFVLAYVISFSIGYLVGAKEGGGVVSYKSKKNKISFWKFALFAPPVIFVAVFIRFFRGYFDQLGFSAALNAVDVNVFLEKSLMFGDFGYSPVVMRLMDLFPNTYDYLYGSSYWRILLTFVPRFIYPDKPYDTQNLIGSIFFPLTPGMTIPPGVNGDAYINFGLLGIIVFIFHGLIFSWIDRRQRTIRLMVFASSFSIVFHYTRGAFTNPIIIFFVVLAACVLYKKIFKISLSGPIDKVKMDV